MSLSKKVLVGFAVMLGLVLILGGVSILVTRDFKSSLDQATTVTAVEQYLAGEANAAASDMASAERGEVLEAVLGDKGKQEECQAKFQAAFANLNKALGDLRRGASTEESRNLLAAIDQQVAQVMQIHEEMRQSMANQQMDSALNTFSSKLQPRLEEVGRKAAALVAYQNKELAAIAQAGAAKSQRLTLWTVLLAVVGLAIGGVLFWLLHQSGESLQKLGSKMAQRAGEVASAASQVSAASHSLAQGAVRTGGVARGDICLYRGDHVHHAAERRTRIRGRLADAAV